MPFYEYQAVNPNASCEHCKNVFEIQQTMNDDPLLHCPECGSEVVKMISRVGGIILGHRAVNQYNDVLQAKYWRDHNGVRHRVTPSDGHSSCPTVSREQIRTPEEVAAIKKRDQLIAKRKRSEASYRRYAKNAYKNKRQ